MMYGESAYGNWGIWHNRPGLSFFVVRYLPMRIPMAKPPGAR